MYSSFVDFIFEWLNALLRKHGEKSAVAPTQAATKISVQANNQEPKDAEKKDEAAPSDGIVNSDVVSLITGTLLV